MSRLNVTKTSIGIASGLLLAAVLVGACSSAATAGPTQVVAGATQATGATPTAVASGAAATLLAKAIGSQTLLVAGSNGMTVYTFTKDTVGGNSTCSGGCLAKWPAVTVAAGTMPTAGDGVTGTLATITRADEGTLQVTYNGLPLYFYSGDSAAGDTNGSYPNWNLVKP
jgi:predicted lipoprotein with Yx(FWY)xxD motif